MSGVGSIHDIISEQVLLVYRMLSLSAVCMDCWFIMFENVSHGTMYKQIVFCCTNLLQEILWILEEAYGKVEMKKTQVYQWHKCFHDGRASVSGDAPCRRPSTVMDDNKHWECAQVVQSDWWNSVQEISTEARISIWSVYIVLHRDLNSMQCHWWLKSTFPNRGIVASTISPGLVTTWLVPVSATKKGSERTNRECCGSHSKSEVITSRSIEK
jgi:hypothetical protein